jgi:RimJ/RimL family protein N-acetyltransferase
MFIRSERLFLRPGWPEDWAELLAVIDDEQVVRHLARAPWPYGPDDARAFASLPQAEKYPHFFVTLPGAHGARLVGTVGLVESEGEAELGFWIARAQWNRGYGTEAIRAVLSLARTLGHRRITARHFIDNPACGRVLSKAGFRATGQTRPCHSPARQGAEPALYYAVDLLGAGNCDDDGGSGCTDAMRAA